MILIPVVLILETECFVHIISPIVTKKSENIIMTFDVEKPERELIFAAHMDSKTDVFDHVDRQIIMILLAPVLIISLAYPRIYSCVTEGQEAGRENTDTGDTNTLRRVLCVLDILLYSYGGVHFFERTESRCR